MLACATYFQVALLEDLSRGRFALSGCDNADVAALNDQTRCASMNDIEDPRFNTLGWCLSCPDAESDLVTRSSQRSTGRGIHRALFHKSPGIEEAASHPLAAFYVQVATAVKSRCVTVFLRDALARFSLTCAIPRLRCPERTVRSARSTHLLPTARSLATKTTRTILSCNESDGEPAPTTTSARIHRTNDRRNAAKISTVRNSPRGRHFLAAGWKGKTRERRVVQTSRGHPLLKNAFKSAAVPPPRTYPPSVTTVNR